MLNLAFEIERVIEIYVEAFCLCTGMLKFEIVVAMKKEISTAVHVLKYGKIMMYYLCP